MSLATALECKKSSGDEIGVIVLEISRLGNLSA
jgi:hypothetical protein